MGNSTLNISCLCTLSTFVLNKNKMLPEEFSSEHEKIVLTDQEEMCDPIDTLPRST